MTDSGEAINAPAGAAPRRAAQAAAKQAGVNITMLSDIEGARLASELFADIWGTQPRVPMPTELLRALAHSGNYVSGAWHGDQLVGASAAFFGQDRSSWILHSHITGVPGRARRRGVGFALKLHQRAWAVERGIAEITWTFDPLVRRNAHFNLTRLAAVAVGYEADFYGRMVDGINAGDATDRLRVSWPLQASTVVAGSARRLPDRAEVDRLQAGATVLVRADSHGDPVIRERGSGPAVGPYLCETPADVEALRLRDPPRARAWRTALRVTLGSALADGCQIAGITRTGWYVLTGPDEEKTIW